MGNWTACHACGLKHQQRADGLCPRCRASLATEFAEPPAQLPLAVDNSLPGARCDGCGVVAPTQFVEFNQNIGLLVIRLTKKIEGNLCEHCVSSAFISTTATTLFLGWWGLISLIVTPFILISNVLQRARARF